MDNASTNLCTRVEKLKPLLIDSIAETESGNRVTDSVACAFRDENLFHTWIPKSLGGWELSPMEGCLAMEEMATVDSASAWMFQMCNAVSLLAAWFDDECIEYIFRDGIPMFGDSFAPPMKIGKASNGYNLNGQSSFVSNCQAIDRFIGLAQLVNDDDSVVLDSAGHAISYIFTVASADFQVIENWDTVGMRGTGSHDVKIVNLEIPPYAAAILEPLEKANNAAYQIPIGPLAIWIGMSSMSALTLGIARSAYEEFMLLCESKTPSYFDSKVGEGALTQYRLGEIHAHLNAAKRYLYGTLEEIWTHVGKGDVMRTEDKRDLAAACAFTTQSANHMIKLIAESAGTSIVRESNALSRRFRDLHTLQQHVFTARNRYQDIGALCLGKPPAFGLLGF
ncbi:MAG: acyl-CoA dehydrogenase family protein [Pseudomonadota bacterium]